MLEIFKVWHNYVWRARTGGRLTAAERIGLVTEVVTEEDILGFDLRDEVLRVWERDHIRAARELKNACPMPF
jgi:hypothetical protein